MTKQRTPAALAAAAIRKELKALFPAEKISVRSDNFSMGDAVRVSIGERVQVVDAFGNTRYSNPPEDAARDIVSKYQYGHFDGMTDYYEHSNGRSDIPQVKYVTVSCFY